MPKLRGLAGSLTAAFLLTSVGCWSPGSDRGAPDLRFEDDPTSVGFGRVLLGPFPEDGYETVVAEEVIAAGPEFEQAFAIWKGTFEPTSGGCAHPDRQQPLLGSYRFRSGFLEFEPRFPWSAGSTYTACADAAALERLVPRLLDLGRVGELLALEFAVPSAVSATTAAPRVEHVWPSLPTVPANLLRIYVHFDRPMRQREVAARVSLVDAEGEALPDGLVPIPEGLWDPQSKRLTLFVHPGRIKRGVGPHERLGAALEAGQTVQLRLDRSMESREGLPMTEDFEQSYRVTEADRVSPDPARWRIEAPATEEEAVTIHFDEVLDHEQLLSFARIVSAGEAAVPGVATPAPDGRSWSFAPAQPWQEQSYRILARRDIEDLAGNRPGRLFDVDTQGLPDADSVVPVAVVAAHEALILPFDVNFER